MDKRVLAIIASVIIVAILLVGVFVSQIGSTPNARTPATQPSQKMTTQYYMLFEKQPQYSMYSGNTPDGYIFVWTIQLRIVSNYKATIDLKDFRLNATISGTYADGRTWAGIMTQDSLSKLTNDNGQLTWNPYKNSTIESGKPFVYTLKYSYHSLNTLESVVSEKFTYYGSENLSLVESQQPLF
jgi:hypothetical protein